MLSTQLLRSAPLASRQIAHQLRSSQQHRIISSNLKQQVRMVTTFKLNTGATIPAVGFGTWQDADAQESAVLNALKSGYRHIDGARVYGTEPMIAKGVKASGVPRNEIFITTKLWNNAHHPDDVEKALDASLKDLDTDYVDLYLMHWPSSFKRSDNLFPRDDNEKLIPGDVDYLDTWKGMEALVKKGKAKAIGVSNFSKSEMDRLLQNSTIKPAAHQLELHPYLQQKSFTKFHKDNDIHVTQYSPFGNQNEIYTSHSHIGKLIDDPTLNEIGKKYGKNGAQVALAWGIAQGHSVIPKSKTPSRIESNLQGDFKLSSEDLQKIEEIDKKLRFNDPSEGFGYKFYSDLDGKK